MVNDVNETVQVLTSRRTVRKFTDEPISPELVAALEDSARQAATSQSLSAWSAVRVEDRATREAIASICGHARIANAPLLYVFVLDQHRNVRIASEHGVDEATNPMASLALFLQAWDDTVLALQSMETAANSLGLGAVILGSIHNDTERIIDTLNLPRYTFPVLAIGIGHPAKLPETKPRPGRDVQFFTDRYPSDADVPSLTDSLADFDAELGAYYARRNPDNPIKGFTQYVTGVASAPSSFDKPIIPIIEQQGFRVS